MNSDWQPVSADWQPVYERRLVKAEAALHTAKDELEDIGFNARKEEDIDELVAAIRGLIIELHAIWDDHYGPPPA